MKAEEVNWVGKECFPCSCFTICSKEPRFWLFCMFRMPRFHVPVGLECMCVGLSVSVTYLVTLFSFWALYWLQDFFLDFLAPEQSHFSSCINLLNYSWLPAIAMEAIIACSCGAVRAAAAPLLIIYFFCFIWGTCRQLLEKWRRFKFCTCFIYWTFLWLVNLGSDYTITWNGPSRLNPVRYS